VDTLSSPLLTRPFLRAARAHRKQRALTVTIGPAAVRRAPVAAHAYSLPVVRELPSQPLTAAQSLAW
jgi:hypothetical protein